MSRRCSAAALAVLAIVGAGCASHPDCMPSQPHRSTWTGAAVQPPEARTVPVELRFVAETLGGKRFHGQDLVGKAAVLWFRDSRCPACRSEAALVSDLAAAHPDVSVVDVVAPGQGRGGQLLVDDQALQSVIQLADPDGAIRDRFGVTGRPAFAFVHPDGRVDVVNGVLPGPDLTRRVTRLAGQ